MEFISTRKTAPAASLAEALSRGIAPDGGLYLPQTIPRLADSVWTRRASSIAETAFDLLAPFAAEDLGARGLRSLLDDAFDFPVPLVRLSGETYLLELFQGPTLAFKDFGARFLARALPRVCADDDPERPITILVATSGDTGGAVAQAFWGVRGTRVIVLYPQGQVTARQESQFATLGGNVRALAVEGTFDDCQRMVKEAFADAELAEEHRLSSANSISLGRLLPQAVYYAHAAGQLTPASEPIFCVPSGNFGNLCAGLIARRMGLPAARFLAACNANDVVPEYLEDGEFRPRPSITTLANAMDVGNPSNLERIRTLYDDDLDRLRRDVWASSHGDEEIRQAISEVEARTGQVIDPHTAVGWLASERYRGEIGEEGPIIILATAHPAKFAEVVEPAIGRELELPAALAEFMARPLKRRLVGSDGSAIRDCLSRWRNGESES